MRDKFMKSNYTLEINDRKQTIQGVKISDLDLYRNIRFVVQSSALEGWQPSAEDILFLIDSAEHPDPKLEQEYREIFGEE